MLRVKHNVIDRLDSSDIKIDGKTTCNATCAFVFTRKDVQEMKQKTEHIDDLVGGSVIKSTTTFYVHDARINRLNYDEIIEILSGLECALNTSSSAPTLASIKDMLDEQFEAKNKKQAKNCCGWFSRLFVPSNNQTHDPAKESLLTNISLK